MYNQFNPIGARTLNESKNEEVGWTPVYDNQPIGEGIPINKWAVFLSLFIVPVLVPLLIAINWRRMGFSLNRSIATLLIGWVAYPVLNFALVYLLLSVPTFVENRELLASGASLVTLIAVYGGLLEWHRRAYNDRVSQ